MSVQQVTVQREAIRARHAAIRRVFELALPLVLLALVPVTGPRLVAVAGHSNAGPLYTVAQLRDHLRHDPGAWVGRTVLVRGVAAACLPAGSPARFLICHHRPQDLLDPGLADASAALPLALGSQDPLLAVLRRLPLAGRLVPPPQAVDWGAEATYRSQLRAVPAGSCTSVPCYEVLLLDAAPGSR